MRDPQIEKTDYNCILKSTNQAEFAERVRTALLTTAGEDSTRHHVRHHHTKPRPWPSLPR